MKKLFALLMIAGTVSLYSCGSAEAPATEDSTKVEAAAPVAAPADSANTLEEASADSAKTEAPAEAAH